MRQHLRRTFAATAVWALSTSLVAASVIGCGSTTNLPSTPTSAAPSTAAGDAGPAKIDEAAAVDLAKRFAAAYGTFSPANPTPGQTWVKSWKSMATDLALTRGTAEFDHLWDWTFHQQVQTHDVMVVGEVTTRRTEFATMVVEFAARRYVLGLAAPADRGTWQNLRFTITLGPHTTTGQPAVYLATMTPD